VCFHGRDIQQISSDTAEVDTSRGTALIRIPGARSQLVGLRGTSRPSGKIPELLQLFGLAWQDMAIGRTRKA
jgi:hypothetical protein